MSAFIYFSCFLNFALMYF